MKSLRWVRSAILVPIILLWTAAMALLSLFFSLFEREGHRLQHGCARTWARVILWVSGVRVCADGLEWVRGSGPFIFVSNHESFFDIFSLLACLPVQFRFFAKESLFRTPFIGWHLRRAGHLPVDRTSARAAYRSFQSATERIRAGTSVVIFPEGSRSVTGEVGPFRKGSLRPALASGAPIVPIAIYGSRSVLPRGSIMIAPGRIYVSVGEPILPAREDLQDKETLMETVRAGIVNRRRKFSDRLEGDLPPGRKA
ncbi:MAG: 1-acyl-sn-glycerol-3-phosphate acyltransferase [Acidobacteria bacterium]|nr:1-acyl-sn-glycerol-3-phosphate acyltransferase [Acidobacteriota bacterium]